MCGRFTLRTPATQWLNQLFAGLEGSAIPDARPRYNISPTQTILTITQAESQRPYAIVPMRWGLIPPWSEELSIGSRMINARSETLGEKPSFRKAFAERRCAIVADGYYEWSVSTDGNKQAYWMHQPNEGVFLMAGLWEVNRKIDPTNPVISTTIITTNANAAIAKVHDRMPVILSTNDLAIWLDPNNKDTAALSSLLHPAEVELIEFHAVSREVNNARNENAKCIEPMELPDG